MGKDNEARRADEAAPASPASDPRSLEARLAAVSSGTAAGSRPPPLPPLLPQTRGALAIDPLAQAISRSAEALAVEAAAPPPPPLPTARTAAPAAATPAEAVARVRPDARERESNRQAEVDAGPSHDTAAEDDGDGFEPFQLERAQPEQAEPGRDGSGRDKSGPIDTGRVDSGRPGKASDTAHRRAARRRPAGPVRERLAANDDAPSIGGLIYSLQQKPSTKPFKYAAIASVVWAMVGLGFLYLTLSADLAEGLTAQAVLTKPTTFLMLTAVAVPISVIWFLALLAWRSEELRLRSSTMAEVAVRLAEPDRMAEQSVASLGQAVRRQVSFMNDAVSRALGRAGELEALVHNEVAALERSYEENEQKIRGLIQELSGERLQLLRTGGDVTETLRTLGTEVPALIEKLSSQQAKLAHIIQGAGDNLTLLETSLTQSAGKLETAVGARTSELRDVLGNYSDNVVRSLEDRTTKLQTVLEEYTGALDQALGSRTEEMQEILTVQSQSLDAQLGQGSRQMQGMLEDYTTALADALGTRTEQMQEAFEEYMHTLDASIVNRTDNLAAVFEEYARALDSTLASRAESLDIQLVERTRALDDAFSHRLRLFDETILRTTTAIDDAVGQKAIALTDALDTHARTFKDTIARQSADLDESLAHGINAVRRSSENITRQSLKAIEGLANQSELLKSVSENLLGQINAVTNRFENQGQTIMRAANALESANYKIDTTLQSRHAELNDTLTRLSGKADEFSNFIEGYSSSIEGQLGEAESKARAAAQQLLTSTETNKKTALADLQRFTHEADQESARALREMRQRFTAVSREVTSQLGTMSSRFDETSDQVRSRAQKATQAIEEEQTRLKAELERIPGNARESAEVMRRALQDQLRALDQLSQLNIREAHARDVSPPVGPGPAGPRGSGPQQRAIGSLSDTYARSRPDGEHQLSSLTGALARELGGRPAGGAPNHPGSAPEPSRPQHAGPAPGQPSPYGAPPTHAASMAPTSGTASPDGRDQWSLGDLLKRASYDDEPSASSAASRPAGAGGPPPGPPLPTAAASGPASLLPDIGTMIRSIDPATASAIWSRLRAGQRGIMVRSMYAPEARNAFDDLAARYRADPTVERAVGQILAEFEHTLREAEKADASGRLLQSHLVSEMGRVYLFLSHVTGRLG
ncbi:MAG: hypothetical protein NW217_12665 [Hyphomicrobiaceae bacterium]|nr:hypothetical protein [Hyphomicrobiaceae bacterium]